MSASHKHGKTPERQWIPENNPCSVVPWLSMAACSHCHRKEWGPVPQRGPAERAFSCGLSCPHGHPTSSTTEQGKKIAFSQSLSGRIRESNRVGLFFEIQPSFSIADLLTSSCEICEDHFPFVYRFGTSFWCAREYMSVYTGASVCYTLLFFYRI